MKKLLTVLLLLAVLITVFSACNEEVPTTPNSGDGGVDESTLSFHFVSLGDGTCIIDGAVIPDGQSSVTLPAVSPDGERVVAVKNLSGKGNVPRYLLEEDYKKIDEKVKTLVAEGKISSFDYAKFSAYYICHQANQGTAINTENPIFQVVSVTYELSNDITASEYGSLSNVYTMIGYGFKDALADYDRCVEKLKSISGYTPSMLKTITYPTRLPEGAISIVLPEGITTIDEFTFCGCGEGVKLTLPAGIERIGNRAFSEMEIEYSGTKAQWNAVKKEGDIGCVTVHCSDGDVTEGAVDKEG